MSSRSRLVILSLALIGLGFASYSAWVHYKLMTDVGYASPCDINQTFNCSQVYLSPYGSAAGVPVALGGVFWFALVAMVAWMATPSAKSAPTPGGAYLFALSTIGLAAILYLGYTSWFVLKTACVLCLGTYAAVLGIFVVSGASASMSVTQLPGRFIGDLTKAFQKSSVLILALLLLGGTAYAVSAFPKEGTRPTPQAAAAPTGQQVSDFATAWFQQPRTDLGIPADGAKVVIVKFNDYLCPGCGATYAAYKPVLEKFATSNPGAVKVVVKDWPWDKECNFNAPTLHEAGCEAAAAVRMARDVSPAKEMEMAEWLYDNQPTLTPAPDAVKAGVARILGVTDFDRAYRLKLLDIQKDIADGVALNVTTTPTMFINGVRIDKQLMPASYFEQAIQLELNKAAGK